MISQISRYNWSRPPLANLQIFETIISIGRRHSLIIHGDISNSRPAKSLEILPVQILNRQTIAELTNDLHHPIVKPLHFTRWEAKIRWNICWSDHLWLAVRFERHTNLAQTPNKNEFNILQPFFPPNLLKTVWKIIGFNASRPFCRLVSKTPLTESHFAANRCSALLLLPLGMRALSEQVVFLFLVVGINPFEEYYIAKLDHFPKVRVK